METIFDLFQTFYFHLIVWGLVGLCAWYGSRKVLNRFSDNIRRNLIWTGVGASIWYVSLSATLFALDMINPWQTAVISADATGFEKFGIELGIAMASLKNISEAALSSYIAVSVWFTVGAWHWVADSRGRIAA